MNQIAATFCRLSEISIITDIVATPVVPLNFLVDHIPGTRVFCINHSVHCWPLLLDSAPCNRQLSGTLRFQKAGLERIVKLTSKHPYLTQLICQRIWQQAQRRRAGSEQLVGEKKPAEPREPVSIGAAEAEEAVEEALEAGDHALDWIWDGLTLPEKIFLAALVELTSNSNGAGVRDI